jgi:hypothetical protein
VICKEIEEPPPIDELIPTNPTNSTPAVTIDVDPTTLPPNYEIGYGFYYRYLFRLPDRVEVQLSREKWLGVGGVSENGDYGTFSTAGDRALTVFQWPWQSNGM